MDMFDRGLRRDPVSEIEDMWTATGGIKDFVDRACHGIAAGNQAHRVEIALECQMRRQCRCRPVHIDTVIDSHTLKLGLVAIFDQPFADTLWKPYQRRFDTTFSQNADCLLYTSDAADD